MGFISKLFQDLVSNSNQTVNNSNGSFDTRKTIDRETAQKMSGSIIIPDCMDEIRDKLFDGNKRITSVTVPGSVKKIGVRAFADCENLERVTLCEGIEVIESNAFTGCKKLRHVTYPDSVKTYQGWSFYGTNLNSPVMNASGTILVFCPVSVSGKEWSVPDTVKVISWQAFIEHKDLEILRLPEGLEKIERMAFINCGIREITIPNSVHEIEKEAFCRCKQLEKVTILNPETKVKSNAFGGCTNIKTINYANLKESDKIFHLKGQPFLIQHLEDPANLKHSADPDFIRLTARCAKGDADAMYSLSKWFEKLSHIHDASLFYIRAANYWRYRAYCKGNADATEWFLRFFDEHPGEHLESILYENNNHNEGWYSFSTPGKMLNDLGYGFFDPNRDYEVKQFEDEDVVEVGSYESTDGPDEDGFGMEEYYDWWFLDENMQEIPGIKSINATMRDRRVFDQFDKEREKAKEYLKRRKSRL